jgi:hypothetical protein
MPRLPRRLTAKTHEAVLINQIIAYLEAVQLRPGRGYRIRYTPQGVALDIDTTDSKPKPSTECPYA